MQPDAETVILGCYGQHHPGNSIQGTPPRDCLQGEAVMRRILGHNNRSLLTLHCPHRTAPLPARHTITQAGHTERSDWAGQCRVTARGLLHPHSRPASHCAGKHQTRAACGLRLVIERRRRLPPPPPPPPGERSALSSRPPPPRSPHTLLRTHRR